MHADRTGWLVVAAAAVWLGAAGPADAFEVTLTVTEPAGIARRYEVVSAGVPMPEDLGVKDVAVLRLLNAEGLEIPAAFRPLAYYPRGERGVRWVQVTFPIDLAASGQAVVRLRDDGPPRAVARSRRGLRWRVMKTGEGVTVETGGARFAIEKQFALFSLAWMDLNGNGRVEGDERIIEKSLNHGGVARDAAGRRYTTSCQPQDLDLVERSDLHCVVRVSGTHRSAEPGAFQAGLYDYEATLTFHRDRPWVWVDYVLKNSPREPRGEPVMTDYRLVTRLNLTGGVAGRVLAERVHDVPLTEGQAAILYQDSDGTKQWDQPPPAPAQSDRREQFRGFQLLTGPVGREQVQAGGLQARGFAELGDGRWGVMAGLLDFWQTYPKALEIDGGGRVVFHLFPERSRQAYWLDDQGHVGHRLVYALFSRRSVDRGPTLEEFARMVSQPAYVTVPADHAQRCGALHDLGPYRMEQAPVPPAGGVLAAREAERAVGREYGWQVFGSSWASRTGRSPGTYHPIRDADTLFRYVATGDRGWFDLGLSRARHLRDVRAYHVDGVDVFTPYGSLREARAALPVGGEGGRALPTDPAVQAFSAGRQPRSRWPLPDEAHLSLDDVYNLYLLTGDAKSLVAAREIAAAARAYLAGVPDADLRPGAEVALCLRALTKYYELVSQEDPRALADIRALAERLKRALAPARAAARADAPQRVTPPGESGLFLRALAMAHRVTGDDDVLDLAIGTGDWLVEYAITATGFGAEHAPGNELKPRDQRLNVGDKPDDPFRGGHTVWCLEPLAWLYTETGDERYLAAAKSVEPFIGEAARQASVSCLPYYYYVAAGLDRIDTVPPAAVSDLEARVEGQAVVLTWTAPGDNGREGKATRFQVKHAGRPIVDVPKVPDQEGSHASWWSAENAVGEPEPAAPGTRQSMRVEGLAPGVRYFALKTWDEAPNASPISNVVKVETR